MNAKVWSGIATVVAAAAMVLAGLAYRSVQNLQQATPDVLQAIDALLGERDAAVRSLRAPPFVEGSSGILDSYLIRLRRDGAPKSGDMKQRLDRLAENTTAIETLLDISVGHARTSQFKAEAARFKTYAVAWRERWNAVTEVFMAGGNFPAAEVPFPEHLKDAVRAELEATR